MSRGGQIVAEFSGSGTAPVLHGVTVHIPDLRYPVNYGRPAQVRFSWTACDPDADTLTQSTYYAPDGADTYRLIGRTTTEPQPDAPQAATTTVIYDNGFVDYSVPVAADTSAPRVFNHLEKPWNLQRSQRAHFVVVVSDGVHWSAAASEEFELSHPRIWPAIWSPKDGAVYRSDDEIVVDGAAEGAFLSRWQTLPDDRLRWHSDMDGAFPIDVDHSSDGSDAVRRIPPGTLRPGIHQITLTATDDTGNTGSETVTIEIAGT